MSAQTPTGPSFGNGMNGMSGSESGGGLSSSLPPALQPAYAQYTKLMRQYRQLLDRSAPHVLYRWLGTLGVVLVFFLRIVFAQGVRLSSFSLFPEN